MGHGIDYAVSEYIGTITLNDPATRNALSLAGEQELRKVFRAASNDPSVRAIILTGAGNTFCVGGNVADLKGNNANELAATAPQPPQSDSIEENYARRFSYLLAIRKPIFAAINGAVAGVGLTLVLYCDIRYMVETAKLTTSFARLGLVAEQGTAWMLPRLIGPMNALDLLMTGRIVTGAEAAALGLVRALPADGFLARVTETVRDLCETASPRSASIIRRQVYNSLNQSLAQSCYESDLEERKSFLSEDFAEGVAHFMERRKPRFTGR